MSLVNTRDLLRIVYHKHSKTLSFHVKSHSKKACTFSVIPAWEYRGDLTGMNPNHRTSEYFMSGFTCFGFKDNDDSISTHVYLPKYVLNDTHFDKEQIFKYINDHFKNDGDYDISLSKDDKKALIHILDQYQAWYCHKYKEWLKASEIVVQRINRDHVNMGLCTCLFDCMCKWELYNGEEDD